MLSRAVIDSLILSDIDDITDRFHQYVNGQYSYADHFDIARRGIISINLTLPCSKHFNEDDAKILTDIFPDYTYEVLVDKNSINLVSQLKPFKLCILDDGYIKDHSSIVDEIYRFRRGNGKHSINTRIYVDDQLVLKRTHKSSQLFSYITSIIPELMPYYEDGIKIHKEYFTQFLVLIVNRIKPKSVKSARNICG